MKLRKAANEYEEEPQTSNKKASCKAKSSKRNIEIGWLHDENGVIKQVRARQAVEGCRKLQINAEARYDDILKEGKALFFPNGNSTKGEEADFEFDVWCFKQNPLPNDVSVGMIYNTVKLPIVRFYVATRTKMSLTEESSDESDQASDISDSDSTKVDDCSQNENDQLEI